MAVENEPTFGNPTVRQIDGKYPILQFFTYVHLKPEFQAVSKPFYELARWMAESLPQNAETSAGLRKLLEAKDCAVRARVQGC